MTVSPYLSNNFRPRVEANSLAHITYGVAEGVANTIDTTLGMAGTIFGVATLGLHKPTLQFAANHLKFSRTILTSPFLGLLQGCGASVLPSTDTFLHGKIAFLRNEALKMSTERKVHGEMSKGVPIYKKMALGNPLGSRIYHVAYTVASLATRIADTAIATLAVPASIITLGQFYHLNNLAVESLRSTSLIVNDLFMLAINLLDPSIK